MALRPDYRSEEAEAYRHLYWTQRWRRKAKAQRNAEPLCRRCKANGLVVPATIANHIVPHKGDEALFWEGELESTCKACHDSLIQIEERQGFSSEIGEDGFPVDPRHPANGGTPTPAIGTAKSHPTWFRKSFIPLTIVCGPPGSGKSTYVAKHASPEDLVICFDRISSSMFDRSGPARAHASLSLGQVGDVLRERNELLGQIMRASARDRWQKAWLIVSEPRADYREWWSRRLKPSAIIVMATPADICKQRVASDAASGDRRHETVAHTIDKWWSIYRPRAGDRVVKPDAS